MNDYLAKGFVVLMVLAYTALALAMIFAAIKWWVWPHIKRHLPRKSERRHPMPHIHEQH